MNREEVIYYLGVMSPTEVAGDSGNGTSAAVDRKWRSLATEHRDGSQIQLRHDRQLKGAMVPDVRMRGKKRGLKKDGRLNKTG